jgi:hypothetical protein
MTGREKVQAFRSLLRQVAPARMTTFCAVWNRAAQRGAVAVGFRRIGEADGKVFFEL